jgi:hypothetical protein
MSNTVVPEVPIYCLLDSDTALKRPAVPKKGRPGIEDLICSYRNLVVVGFSTLERLERGKVPDPTVGENACQIRGTMFAAFLNAVDFPAVLLKSKRVLARNLNRLLVVELPKEDASLESFLRDNRLCAELDRRVVHLVAGRLLELSRGECVDTFAKDAEGNVSPEETVRDTGGLVTVGFSVTLSQKIDRFAKKFLADASVAFLQREALKVSPSEKGELLYSLVSGENVRTTKMGLRTAPCFSGTRVLLDKASRRGIPLVLHIFHVDGETAQVATVSVFFFLPERGRYVPAPKRAVVTASRGAIRFDAASITHPVLSREQLVQELLSRDFCELLLACMAGHPPYGGDLKTAACPLEERALAQEYAAKAEEWGCSVRNPRLCRFWHVYPVSTLDYKEEPEG